MRGKQILAWAVEIPKQNWGNQAIFRDNLISNDYSKRTVKYKTMCGGFFFFFVEIEAFFIIYQKCMVTPNFSFGYQEPLLSSTFSA